MIPAGSFLLDDPPDVPDRQFPRGKYVPDCRGNREGGEYAEFDFKSDQAAHGSNLYEVHPRHILDALIASGRDRNRRLALSMFICANGSHDIGLISVPV